jgi:hypothetical protein
MNETFDFTGLKLSTYLYQKNKRNKVLATDAQIFLNPFNLWQSVAKKPHPLSVFVKGCDVRGIAM